MQEFSETLPKEENITSDESFLETRRSLVINKFEADMSSSILLKKMKLTESNRGYKALTNGPISYFSKGDNGVSINGSAKDKNNESIDCRHLVWNLVSTNRGIKNYHYLYGSIEGIQSIDPLINNILDQEKLLRQLSYYNIFNINFLGEKLQSIASCLERGEETNLLLLSEIHAMGFTLMHKKIQNNNSQYIIKFYDPNITNKHIRIVCENLNQVGLLVIHDMTSAKLFNIYFSKYKQAILCSTKLRNQTTPVIIRNSDSYNDLFFIIQCNLLQFYPNIIQEILDSTNDSIGQKYALLEAKSSYGSPILYLALQDDNVDSVLTYMNLIFKSSELDLNQKIKLVTANSENGCPGLFIALQRGNTEVIKAYIHFISNLPELNPTHKIELLTANHFGATGLFIALQKGHTKAIKAYIELILGFKWLEISQVADLLSAKNSGMGAPGLYVALQDGHTDAIMGYMELILSIQELDLNQKIELLTAKNMKGTPGLFLALQCGRTETIKAYIELILSLNEIECNQKIQLITAKSINGVSGLFVALHQGHLDTVKMYVELILNSRELISIHKVELLTVKSKRLDGFYSSSLSLSETNQESIKIYINLILNSEILEINQKNQLLSLKNEQGNLFIDHVFEVTEAKSIKTTLGMLNRKESDCCLM